MTLTLIQRNPDASAAPRRADFRAPGGTLGRDPANHLVLPDDAGKLCRVQAALRVEPYACRLRNLSSMGSVSINDVPLPAGQELSIAPGDTLRIGSYVLGVELTQAGGPVEAPSVPSPQPAPVPVAMPDFPDLSDFESLGKPPAGEPDPLLAEAPSGSRPQDPPEDVFSGLFGPGTLPVGTVSDVSAHPFEMESAQARNAADPLAHLPRGDATVSRPQRDPLAMFDAPHGGDDVFSDPTPSALPAHDPLAPMRSDPVRDALQRPLANEDRPPARDNAPMSGAFLRPASPRPAARDGADHDRDRPRNDRGNDR